METNNTNCDVTNSNLFIIFFGDIHEMGGGPLFILEYIRYLKKNNWDVLLFSTSVPLGKNRIEELDEYIRYGNPVFGLKPGELNSDELNIIKKTYLDAIRGKYEKVFLFSIFFEGALWGELFAQELKGKHIICDVNEPTGEVLKKYISYEDFFSFKYQRGEFYSTAGMTDFLLKKFHMNHIKGDRLNLDMYANPIQELVESNVANICRLDFNIAYVGRPNKPYFYHVIESVRDFTYKHKDKQVQFFIMGDAENYYEYICRRLLCFNNIKVVFLGVCFPIPRELYRKVDVIIAGSGSAIFSAYERKPVIVPNAVTYMSNGIMGYTCEIDECIVSKFPSNRRIIDDLEDALITKTYLKNEFNMPRLKDLKRFFQQIKVLFNKEICIEYYNVLQDEPYWKHYRKKDINRHVKGRELLSKARTENSKFIIFGAGSDGGLCRQWLEYIGVKVYAFVDSDNRKWNDGYINYGIPVMSPDILIDLGEEAIVIIASSNYSSSIWKWLDEKGISKNGNCIEFAQLSGYPII